MCSKTRRLGDALGWRKDGAFRNDRIKLYAPSAVNACLLTAEGIIPC